MVWKSSSERLGGAIEKARRHWEKNRQTAAEEMLQHGPPPGPPWTIALSREAGIDAGPIVQEIAQRLGWTIYDKALLEQIAKEMGLRTALLESVDERGASWLGECLAEFAAVPTVTESGYVRHLVETILSLAAHGNCILVGRGAAQILPTDHTLRVRLVAPLKARLAAAACQGIVSEKEAARLIEKTEKERRHFIQDHFHKDPADPAGYDLVLNTDRLNAGACADLILETLHRLQASQPQESLVKSP